MNALKIAAALKREADDLLFSQGLENQLKKYGPVIYGGSYALDLLAWADIDLYLDLDGDPNPIEAIGNLAKDIALRPDMRRVVIEQNAHLRIGSLPVGLYLGAKITRGTHIWKIDVWVISKAVREKTLRVLDEFRRALTPENRRLVLEMKQSLMTGENRTPRFSGFFLYQAILSKGLSDPKEICNYLRENGVKV